MRRCLFSLIVVSLLASGRAAQGAESEPIARVLPPVGLEIPAEVKERLQTRLAEIKRRLKGVKEEARPDVEVFTKAVELALAHREFYVERDFAKADWALDQANQRLAALAKGEAPWAKTTGLVVRGYRSNIDDSVQPYGLVIPEGHDFTKPCPLYVWLHGRGDKNTDLHFLQDRSTRPGQITPSGAIVVHPFGRHCVGWKHAGEIDVLEAVADVERHYPIDASRIVLIGFSMGGAGAWHIGAHYTDKWVAVCPGAGFAETARYQRLTPDRFPPSYEQTLWGLYDVPGYVRNLFNTQTIAYSGELDRQIQAARVMEEAFQAEGRTLTHLIGPGVEHKYEPETLQELLKRIDAVVAKGQDKSPNEVHLQTRTLRYPKQKWVKLEGLEEHWKDARVDAVRTGENVRIATQNVRRIELATPADWAEFEVLVDGHSPGERPFIVISGKTNHPIVWSSGLTKEQGSWRWLKPLEGYSWPRKIPGMQGPIDDAFLSPFIVVTPSGKSRNSAFQAWCEAELAHFQSRWLALMRGTLPVVSDKDLDLAQLPRKNLVLFGDADSNAVIRHLQSELPVKFEGQQWRLGDTTYDGNRFVPAYIYPLPQSGVGLAYVVLNSGLTFREGHDRTNSLQNPKLPDWAIIDITQPPDALAPGRIHDAGFFDEQWQLKGQPKAP